MPLNRRNLGQRLEEGEVDLSLRSAYGMMGVSPKTPQEVASDYYQIDFVSNNRLVHWIRLICSSGMQVVSYFL